MESKPKKKGRGGARPGSGRKAMTHIEADLEAWDKFKDVLPSRILEIVQEKATRDNASFLRALQPFLDYFYVKKPQIVEQKTVTSLNLKEVLRELDINNGIDDTIVGDNRGSVSSVTPPAERDTDDMSSPTDPAEDTPSDRHDQ